MTDEAKVLAHMDDEAIRWQKCAICGEQKQKVIRTAGRPDFAFCQHCEAAFILEDGGKMRLYYGNIPMTFPQTRAFALRQWHTYFEINARGEAERAQKAETEQSPDIPVGASIGQYANHEEALADLSAQATELIYAASKKTPSRRLKETGQLPSLDGLFHDIP
jgi:hypothetical protein